jgi:AraC-like DNA-binding protein
MLLAPDTFRRLCTARDLLTEVPEQPLSIKDIARQAHISPFHFIRQFEALFGLTPHQFRIQSRLHRAKILLVKGHPVTDVCMEVGFDSLGSFSTLFARRVGASPSMYQRRARVLIHRPEAIFPGCLSLMGLLPPDAFSQF